MSIDLTGKILRFHSDQYIWAYYNVLGNGRWMSIFWKNIHFRYSSKCINEVPKWRSGRCVCPSEMQYQPELQAY